MLSDGDAVRGLLDDEASHAAVRWVRSPVRLCEHCDGVAAFSVSNEHLPAVDDVLLAVSGGGGLDASEVASRIRLGERKRAAYLSARHRG